MNKWRYSVGIGFILCLGLLAHSESVSTDINVKKVVETALALEEAQNQECTCLGTSQLVGIPTRILWQRPIKK